MIRIVVDSASDYRADELNNKNMDLVPITVSIGEESFRDGIELERDFFYETLEKTGEFPKTSQPSPQAFLDVFLNAKENGDDVICILVSSELSGTFQSAVLARNMAEYDHIYLVDSLAATHVMRIMAEYACCKREEGLDAAFIVPLLNDLRARIRVAAVLDTLEYLHRGGRLSKTAANLGELASLKPTITLTDEGKIGILAKSLGKNKAACSLLKFVRSQEPDPDFPIYTLYTYGTDNCCRFEEKLSADGITVTGRLQIGPSIGSHIGPEAFGVLYVAKSDNN